jgi:hypothetical protein
MQGTFEARGKKPRKKCDSSKPHKKKGGTDDAKSTVEKMSLSLHVRTYGLNGSHCIELL